MPQWRKFGIQECAYTPQPVVNILSLGLLDEHGCRMKLQSEILVTHDHHWKLLIKV